MKTKTQKMVMCALCAAIMCVLAPLALPIGPVPISLGTFAVMLAAALLPPQLSLASVALYLLLGAVNLPVFAGFSGGVKCLAGPTGGYLFGYLALAVVQGALLVLLKKRVPRVLAYVLSMVAGTAVLYLFGTMWFSAMSHISFVAALVPCVLPFLPGDAVKIAAVTVIAPQVSRVMNHLPERCSGAAA